MKKHIPQSIKIKIHLFLRWLRFRIFKPTSFAKQKQGYLKAQITIPLEIKKTGNFAHKLNNITLAASKLDGVIIYPGEVLSFWKSVGRPGKAQGFLESRTIMGNTTSEEYGGGICQVSGLAYYLALHSGLEIVERYSHSRDIYTDETRFTPLGTDATVVYGYKDLMIRNNKTFPIQLGFEIKENIISGSILSDSTIEKIPFQSKLVESGTSKSVYISDSQGNMLSKSVYYT